MASVQVCDDFSGGSENLRALDTRACNRDFTVGAALVESKGNGAGVMVPVEGIFHFVAVKIIAVVGENRWTRDCYLVFAKKLDDEILFYGKFVIVIQDLPRRSGEETGIFRGDTVRGWTTNRLRDSFAKVGFLFGKLIFYDFLARKGVPEKNLLTAFFGGKSFAARNEFVNSNHILYYIMPVEKLWKCV